MKRAAAKWLNGRSVAIAAAVAAALICLGIVRWMRSPGYGLPFHDTFATSGTSGWTWYAGNWTVVGNMVQNDSDERGAKLIAGSSHWTSYAMEADLQILGGGDAGIVIRASNLEDGVDSYDGYYAGLRTEDNSLTLGRAKHGWYEFPAVPVPGGVIRGKWYHLRLAAQGCILTASATEIGTTNTAQIQTSDDHCLTSGQAGLRSMGAGGSWRNIRIVRLGDKPVINFTASTAGHLAVYPTSQGRAPAAEVATPVPSLADRPAAKSVQSIRSLRLLSISRPAHVVVRGAVVLTGAAHYVQDSSGGVRVEAAHPLPLRVGDEVEIEGDAYPEGLSATIRNASERVLGGQTPIPPLSVTADQAASGDFDSMFVEIEGRLTARATSANHAVLEFTSGPQTYRALADSDVTRSAFDAVDTGSIVRLRGVCMVSPSYTGNAVPFVLIVDSPGSLRVLAGPPWWSTEHLILLALAMLGSGFLGHLLYSRAEEWRSRAVIRERERLAHEMHDTLSQSFAGIGFQLRAVRNLLLRNGGTVDSPALLEKLNIASELVRHSHDEARRSIASLRPEVLEANGLLAALEQSARRTVARGSVTVQATCSGEPRPLPLRVLDALFGIGQEAIANAIHHGHPKCIHICMEYEISSVTLLLEDDGVGFTHQPEGGGYGIAGIRRRANAVHGVLDIVSAPGSGTRISVRVPTSRISLLKRLAYIRRRKGELRAHAS
ncbi:MAG: histidine kinase [Acidobacteriota bacterium]|nr:histidine kinase [Acidobacteriota bacterium]